MDKKQDNRKKKSKTFYVSRVLIDKTDHNL